MDPSMYKAATTGDVGFLHKIRVGEVSSDLLSHKTPKGNNILHLAAELKKITFFKDVPSFEKGIPLLWDINEMRNTPLHIAARVGCVELVDFLVDRAKMLHVQRAGDQERGPNYAESYKKLLRKTNLEMHTALHVAARYGHRGVVISLIKADPELCCSTNSTKESPLFLATCKRFSDIAHDILEVPSITPSFRGINGVTALHVAVTQNYPGAEEIVKIMVSKYPDMIKEADALGWTPLHYAAFRGNDKAVTLLMESDKSSTSYISDKCGMTALHVAAYKGNIKVMKDLIELRPDTCDCVNAKNQTILHVAVLGEQSKVVEYIMNKPEFMILIDQVDEEGNTPFDVAVTCENHEIIRILAPDYRVENTTIHTEFSLVSENVLGDNKELQEIFNHRRRSFGVPLFQEQIRSDFKKLEYGPDSPEEKENSETSAVADNKENLKSGTNLIIATLIATVTFTAALAPPGGYGDDGKMILRENTDFKWFQAFNMMSFVFSVLVLFYESVMAYVGSKPFSIKPGNLILVSLYGLFLAMVLGTRAAQTKNWITITFDPRSNLVLIVSGLLALGPPHFIRKRLEKHARGKP